MLQQLWDHISNCYARAADARRCAEQTADPDRRADLLLMEESWKQLARSYELSEQLGAVLLDHSRRGSERMDWRRATVAPFDCELELARIGANGIQAADFPCRRILHGWIASGTGVPLEFEPTHWREWPKKKPLRSGLDPRKSAADQRRKGDFLLLQSTE